MQPASEAIGGYFGLDESSRSPTAPRWMGAALHYQSARAAFLALLTNELPAAVWLPEYICHEMVETVRAADIVVKFYPNLDEFTVPDLKLDTSEWLVCVNYFGTHGKSVADALARLPARQIVVDHAHAYFSPPAASLATIYSPRKFFGVPDGGHLVTTANVSPPLVQDEGSQGRSQHLYMRATVGPENGYGAYQAAERSLIGLTPMRMSDQTETRLSQLDMTAMALTRRRNFDCLQSLIGDRYPAHKNMAPDDVPLCYPIRNGSVRLREFLISKRVYVANYWPQLQYLHGAASPAVSIARSLVPLPIDHRYGLEEIARLASILASYRGD